MSPKIFKRSNHLTMISHLLFSVHFGFRFNCLDPFFSKFLYFHRKKACIQNFFNANYFNASKMCCRFFRGSHSLIHSFTLYLSSEKTKCHNQKLKILKLITNRSNSNRKRKANSVKTDNKKPEKLKRKTRQFF